MFANQREVGAYSQGKCGSDNPRLPAAVPGAHHDGDAEKGEATFRDIRQEDGGDQRQGRAEHSYSIAQDGCASGRNAE